VANREAALLLQQRKLGELPVEGASEQDASRAPMTTEHAKDTAGQHNNVVDRQA
jgi:hypothetical protein